MYVSGLVHEIQLKWVCTWRHFDTSVFIVVGQVDSVLQSYCFVLGTLVTHPFNKSKMGHWKKVFRSSLRDNNILVELRVIMYILFFLFFPPPFFCETGFCYVPLPGLELTTHCVEQFGLKLAEIYLPLRVLKKSFLSLSHLFSCDVLYCY